jgi:hypothetical protein
VLFEYVIPYGVTGGQQHASIFRAKVEWQCGYISMLQGSWSLQPVQGGQGVSPVITPLNRTLRVEAAINKTRRYPITKVHSVATHRTTWPPSAKKVCQPVLPFSEQSIQWNETNWSNGVDTMSRARQNKLKVLHDVKSCHLAGRTTTSEDHLAGRATTSEERSASIFSKEERLVY